MADLSKELNKELNKDFAYCEDALGRAENAIGNLPSVQPEKRTEERTETHACDLIDRQAAIDALHMHLMYRMGTDSNKKRLDEWINNLPSAQPDTDRIWGALSKIYNMDGVPDEAKAIIGDVMLELDGEADG